MKSSTPSTYKKLEAARHIADLAQAVGITNVAPRQRPMYDHIGALLADSILQAGLNYSTVVLPRVKSIIFQHPKACNLNHVVLIIDQEQTGSFLQWKHEVKIRRFERLVSFLCNWGVSNTSDMRDLLSNKKFRDELLDINGIGPKTIDYMACLTGANCIVVDRHIRTFAKNIGILEKEYDYLQDVFSYAADLLSIPRREFDAWIWQFTSSSQKLNRSKKRNSNSQININNQLQLV